MTLSILEPIEVLAENISGNIDLEAEWLDGPNYNLGQQRRIADTLYEVVADTTDKSPVGANRDWINIGPANLYAAFDLQVGADKYRVLETASKRSDVVEFNLSGLSRIGRVSFFGVKATRIEVSATSGDGQTIVANASYDMLDDADYNGSFWNWAFSPKEFETSYTLFDINIPSGSQITIRVLNPGAVAEVASIAMGVSTEYGTVLVGTNKKLRPRASRDFTGLLATLIPRRPTYVISYKLILQNNSAAAFWRKVESLEGRPAVFSGSDNHPEFIAYGYIESASGDAQGVGITTGSLDLGTI